MLSNSAAASPASPRSHPQFSILFRRNIATIMANPMYWVLMLALPWLVGALLSSLIESDIWTQASHGNFQPVQRTLFFMAVCAVLIGLFPAMVDLEKERASYHRERMVGLHLSSYLGSKIVIFSLNGLYQSFVLVLCVLLKAPYDEEGVFMWAPIEFVISVLLIALGGMMLGLLISAAGRNKEVIVLLAALMLIPQIILNSTLGFVLKGIPELMSKFLFTSWGLEALGDTAGLSVHTSKIPDWTGPEYGSDISHLLSRWFVLLLLLFALLVLITLFQRRWDKREPEKQ